jgi:hypothetical protein
MTGSAADLLAQRRELSSAAILERRTESRQQEALMPLDADDYAYRRITNGAKFETRDLSPLQHDRMLEVVWYLWERNPFAQRLITLMTDLIIGEGVTIDVRSDDNRIQEVIDKFISRNQLGKRIREFYIANSLNGELIFPTGVNPISGTVVLGYLDSLQVKGIKTRADNILDLEQLVVRGIGGQDDISLDIIREDEATGLLVGNCFLHQINKLPNQLRGRSDIGALADWLDLYDQFMFAEVERLNLISAFAWDYTIEDENDPAKIAAKVRALPKLKAGAVFGHNQKEKLEPRTPDLKAADRSEVAHLLRVHIAGTFGFPTSYFGDIDSNRATIEGQNDVLMKTPAARQKEFGGFLSQLFRFAIESTVGKNPALFHRADPVFRITLPEIAAKDIARVGQVMAQVASAADTSLANRTMSRQVAMRLMVAMAKQLGVETSVEEMADEIEADDKEREELGDLVQAQLAARGAGDRRLNPPVPDDPAEGE